MAKLYSIPKLYVPKKQKGTRRVPSVDPGSKWYVYFYYQDPATGKMSSNPFKVYLDINRYKTVKERKAYGKLLVKVVLHHLNDGYNPYVKGSAELQESKIPSINEAFEQALFDRKGYLKVNTYRSYADYLKIFLKWLDKKGVAEKPISALNKQMVVDYLNYMGRPKPEGKGLKPTSVHNHKLNLSAIFKQVVKNGWADKNYIAEIETQKNKPTKNEPFSPAELEKLRGYLRGMDSPYMYQYFLFLFYSLLRNREILRLQVKDVDLERRVLTIETKGEKKSTVYIIDPLKELLDSWQLHTLPFGLLPDHPIRATGILGL